VGGGGGGGEKEVCGGVFRGLGAGPPPAGRTRRSVFQNSRRDFSEMPASRPSPPILAVCPRAGSVLPPSHPWSSLRLRWGSRAVKPPPALRSAGLISLSARPALSAFPEAVDSVDRAPAEAGPPSASATRRRCLAKLANPQAPVMQPRCPAPEPSRLPQATSSRRSSKSETFASERPCSSSSL